MEHSVISVASPSLVELYIVPTVVAVPSVYAWGDLPPPLPPARAQMVRTPWNDMELYKIRIVIGLCVVILWMILGWLILAVYQSADGYLVVSSVDVTECCCEQTAHYCARDGCSCSSSKFDFVDNLQPSNSTTNHVECKRMIDSFSKDTFDVGYTVPGSRQLVTGECWFHRPRILIMWTIGISLTAVLLAIYGICVRRC